jgi:hypothetical protein
MKSLTFRQLIKIGILGKIQTTWRLKLSKDLEIYASSQQRISNGKLLTVLRFALRTIVCVPGVQKRMPYPPCHQDNFLAEVP